MRTQFIGVSGALMLLGTPAFAQNMPQVTQPIPRQVEQQQRDTTAQRRISEYFERDVYLADGTEVGEVEDILVDSDNRITSAVVDVESRMGLGERRVALPLERLKIDSDRLVLDMTAEQLKQLPTHADDNGK